MEILQFVETIDKLMEDAKTSSTQRFEWYDEKGHLFELGNRFTEMRDQLLGLAVFSRFEVSDIFNCDFVEPCNRCAHQNESEFDLPCVKCSHNVQPSQRSQLRLLAR